jgi:DNA invertase Pin-like site-specific DNA recombinase
MLGEVQARDIDLYLPADARHQQAVVSDAVWNAGCVQEFERAMIRDRVMAGLDRARSSGKRLGRPRTTPFTVQRIRAALEQGRGVREAARLLKVSVAKVSEVPHIGRSGCYDCTWRCIIGWR